MIAWEKISPKLGDWAPYFKPFYDLGGFEDIYSELKEQNRRGNVLPQSKDLFNCFLYSPPKDLKCIWVGMD